MPGSHTSNGRPPIREPALALALLFIGTGALAAVSWAWPAISGWLQALLALLLLTVPGFVLRNTGTTIDDLGVQMGPWRRTLVTSWVAILVVFPPFVLGYHVLQVAFFDREAAWSADGLARWDEDVRSAPPAPCAADRETTRAWTTRTGLWVVAPPGTSLEARLDADSSTPSAWRIRCTGDGPRAVDRAEPEPDGSWRSEGADGLWFSVSEPSRFRLRLSRNGSPLPSHAIETGAWSRSPDEAGVVEGERSWWWLLPYIVVHLGLVALPEEWFFRGYLQTRLDQRLGTPWSLFGARFGPGLLWAAVAFALLHPILIPGVHRLLVFFPALAFGLLRARTGTIGAAVVFHAASNVLLAVISRMYV